MPIYIARKLKIKIKKSLLRISYLLRYLSMYYLNIWSIHTWIYFSIFPTSYSESELNKKNT